ncbi:gastrin-releasing peptide [Xyrauchen texanus]|uniref:gastrin-releasing peptide n=1 Tax=Xyrauchen texanus TaxID=154827 RepID=UPI0022429EFA|nr:gastrin-releasing peptide [Xyrauchen texanus]
MVKRPESYMGVMCFVWRHRLAVSFILVLVVCDGYATDGAQPLGKVYPRGNHWAVGHLMGKKSTDELLSPDEPDSNDERSLLLRLLQKLVREQVVPESARESSRENDALQLLQRVLVKGRHWEEERERERQLKLVEDLILQAVSMKDDNTR